MSQIRVFIVRYFQRKCLSSDLMLFWFIVRSRKQMCTDLCTNTSEIVPKGRDTFRAFPHTAQCGLRTLPATASTCGQLPCVYHLLSLLRPSLTHLNHIQSMTSDIFATMDISWVIESPNKVFVRKSCTKVKYSPYILRLLPWECQGLNLV